MPRDRAALLHSSVWLTGAIDGQSRPQHGAFGFALLPQILDAHPDIACPPELNLAVAFDAIMTATGLAFASEKDAALTATRATCHQLADSTAGRPRSDGQENPASAQDLFEQRVRTGWRFLSQLDVLAALIGPAGRPARPAMPSW